MKIRTLTLAAVVAASVVRCETEPALAGHVTRDAVAAEIRTEFAGDAQHALAVADCESGLDPHATHRNRNGTVDYGVFQLNSGGTLQSLGLTPRAALDYRTNIRAARRLQLRRGWSPWVCSRRRG